MLSTEDKVWGITCQLIDSKFYAKHRLSIKAGGYCSLHYHLQRANRFVSIDARVEVIEFYGPEIKRTMLGPGDVFDVPSLVPHLFAVHCAGLMEEEYYADRGGVVDNSDIYRLVPGGIISVNDLKDLPTELLRQYETRISVLQG